MKDVLELIEQKKQEFAQLPLFKFLQDKSISPQDRLVFAPCLAPFAMGFADLNKYALRIEPATTRVEEIINTHTYEDDHHWEWFLEDLEKLELNHVVKLSDALRFMWGDATAKTRQVCTKIAAMCITHNDPVLKLAIIEAIEATGNVALRKTADVASELGKISKERYRYFGESHYIVETGHATGTDDIEQFIVSLTLTPEIQSTALKLVEEVFAVFTDSVNELMAYVEAHRSQKSWLSA